MSLPLNGLTLVPLFALGFWSVFATLRWRSEREDRRYWESEAIEVHKEYIDLAREHPFY